MMEAGGVTGVSAGAQVAREGPSLPIRLALFAASAAFVGLASSLSISTPRPSLLAPYSLLVVLPYFLASPLVAILAGPLLFGLTGAGLLRRRPRLGMPVACFVVLAILSALWLAWGYERGMRHYGAAHTHGMIAVNALSAGILAALTIHARERASFGTALLFHTLTWSWASWSAFAWLRQLF